MKKIVIAVGIMVLMGMALFAGTSSVTATDSNWTNSQYTLTATVVNTNSLFPTERVWNSAAVSDGILEHNGLGLNRFEIKFNEGYANELPDGITVLNSSINLNFLPWVPSVKEYPWGEVIQSAPWVGMWETLLAGGTGLEAFIRKDPRVLLYGAVAIGVYNLIISNISLNHKIVLNKKPNG